MNERETQGFSRIKPFSIGRIGADVERYARLNGIQLGSNTIMFSYKFVAHALRESKGDKRVSKNDIVNFPINKNKMDKYYDGECFIFTDYKVKFIVHPNYELKMTNGKRLKANIITAGKVTDATEFELPKYDRIN